MTQQVPDMFSFNARIDPSSGGTTTFNQGDVGGYESKKPRELYGKLSDACHVRGIC